MKEQYSLSQRTLGNCRHVYAAYKHKYWGNGHELCPVSLSIFTSLTFLMPSLSTTPPYSPTLTFHLSPSSPVCVFQLILWVRLATEWGQPTRVHIIKENQLSSLNSYETSTSSAIPWLPPPRAGILCALSYAGPLLVLQWGYCVHETLSTWSHTQIQVLPTNPPPFIKKKCMSLGRLEYVCPLKRWELYGLLFSACWSECVFYLFFTDSLYTL